jgi:hypothetical protein
VRQFLEDRDMPALVRRHAVLAGALASALILSLVVYSIVSAQQRNRRAIEKGCILLNNKIIEAASPQAAAATSVLIREILRNAEQHHRGYVVVQYKHATANHAGRLSVINCREVAQHPDEIHALKP